jgi:hypothetical protein
MPQTFLSSYSGEWVAVKTSAQARLLSDRATLRHLEPFIGRTLGAAQAAREAGVSTERMLYRVRQLQAAGLLTTVGEQRRGGRPIRLYTAPGGLRLPFALTPFADLEAQLGRQMLPFDRLRARVMARELTRHGLGGRLLYRGDDGQVHSEVEIADQTARRALMRRSRSGDFVAVLHLTDLQAERAQTLLEELRRLVSAEDTSGQDARPYLIQTALVQLSEADLPGTQASPG